MNPSVFDAGPVDESVTITVQTTSLSISVSESSSVTESTNVSKQNNVVVSDPSIVTDVFLGWEFYYFSLNDPSTVTDLPSFYPDLVFVTENLSISVTGISLSDISTVSEFMGFLILTPFSPNSFDSSTVTDFADVVVGNTRTIFVSETRSVTESTSLALVYPESSFDSSTVTEYLTFSSQIGTRLKIQVKQDFLGIKVSRK